MPLIDLTHPLTNGMPVFPGSPPLVLDTLSNIGTHGFNEIQMHITTHTGTHIDCGKHLITGGFDTGSTSPERFYGQGLVIDCRHEGFIIPAYLLRDLEKEKGKPDFILLHTGWSKFWGNAKYFTKFPVLSPDATEYLLSLNLKGVGVDAPSFDPVDSESLPNHIKLLSDGLVLIENLTGLEHLPAEGFIFSCLPLKISEGDGSPVRAVGIVRS